MLNLPKARVYGGGGGGLQAIPTRAELLGGQCTFQGLIVQTEQYGPAPLFDPMIPWLDRPRDRAACYAEKRRVGDTIVCLALSGQYHEGDPHNFLERIPGRDYSQNLPAFRDVLTEALTVGGMRGIRLMLAGDGLGAGPGYNDQGGMTYGHDWLMANFPRIFDGLSDFSPYVVWYPGFDGYIPGWAGPENDWHRVNQWLAFARAIVGQSGYLGSYESAGYWAWSGETNDYSHDEGLEVDQVCFELPYPMGPPLTPVPADFCNQSDNVRGPFDQVWQISNRALGPAYRRPPDQPACDDDKREPGIGDGKHGKRFLNCAEFDTYGTVRGLDPAITAQRRAYLRSLGWEFVG